MELLETDSLGQVLFGIVNSLQQHSNARTKLQKKQALLLYLEGLGLRSIGRILGFSHVTIYQWIKAFGQQIIGSGLLLLDLGNNTLLCNSATEVLPVGNRF